MSAIPAELLPRFRNHVPCGACGNRGDVRVEFSRADALAIGDHFLRRCTRCGHVWAERCGMPDAHPPTKRGPRPESPQPPDLLR
jgi:hypothetical protein